MLKFLLLVNKQGQPRITQYYANHEYDQRQASEAEIIRKCLSRTEKQVSVRRTYIYIYIYICILHLHLQLHYN